MKMKLKNISRQVELIGRALRGLKYWQVVGPLQTPGTAAAAVAISTN